MKEEGIKMFAKAGKYEPCKLFTVRAFYTNGNNFNCNNSCTQKNGK